MFEHRQDVEAIKPQELQCSFLSVSGREGRLVDEKLMCALFHLCPFLEDCLNRDGTKTWWTIIRIRRMLPELGITVGNHVSLGINSPRTVPLA